MKRKKYSSDVKFSAVIKLLKGESTAVELSKEYGCHPTLIGQWKDLFMVQAPSLFNSPNKRDDTIQKIAELERIIGKLTVQNEFLKKVSERLGLR